MKEFLLMTCSEFYDEIFEENNDKWNIPWRDEFAYLSLPKQFSSVLDIGCGNGHTLKYFSERMPADYYGIDFSSKAIEIARRNAPEAMFFCEPFLEAELPHCELAIAMGTVEHFEDLDVALKKIRNIADYAYIEAPNCLAYSNSKNEGFRTASHGIGQEEWHLTRETWEKKIDQAGFDIEVSIGGKSKTTEFVWVLK